MEGGLAELHTHLGGAVASDILWSLAHEQGIALPVKDYWEFDRLVTVSEPHGVEGLEALNEIYHWTDLIQSSPLAVERSVHAAIGGPRIIYQEALPDTGLPSTTGAGRSCAMGRRRSPAS